jgi:beta-glucanase (GH16 family)
MGGALPPHGWPHPPPLADGVTMRALLPLAMCGALTASAFAAAPNVPPSTDKTVEGEPDVKPKTTPALDLTGYELTFHDEFDSFNITRDGGAGPWFAPVHPRFGAVRFLPPSDNGPFFVHDGILTIRAQRQPNGKWVSGFMQSVDSKGRGFAQQYGYFEMRAKMPGGAATWPAFWLASQENYLRKDATRSEIDIVEGYGDQPDVIHSVVHVHPYRDRKWYLSKQARVSGMSADFHRYGAMVTPTWVIFYFDGEELSRFPTLDQYRTPLYLLVDLAMVNRPSLQKADSPSDMQVDYVRVYAKTP